MRARSRIVYFTGNIKAYNNAQACFSTGVAFSVAFGILYRLNYLNRHRAAHLCSAVAVAPAAIPPPAPVYPPKRNTIN